jgi:succinyl-CoA synthetase beta subunit
MLSEWEAGELLREYGVPTAPQRLCSSMTEAVRAARESGGPVVMKACAPSLAHKSDLGLVAVGVAGPTAVRTTYRHLVERASRHGVALDGILVAEHQGRGLETVVGVIDDEVFGPTVMVGMGGVEVEVVPDVTFRVPPFGRAEVRFMLSELRSAARFGRVRNQPGVDLTALTDLVVRVGDMAVDLRGHLLELDLNPVLVRRGRGQGAVVLDALATWSS